MVSIVLVTYNRAERLRLSITDILDQTFKGFELIICDDCSTDDTEVVCREFSAIDSRIRYYRQSSNQQMPANLNFGIKQSVYEYVAFLHDGDRFRSDLIQRWYNAISANESVGFVFNAIGETDKNEKTEVVFREFEEGIVSRDYLLKEVYFRRWLFDSPVWGEAMVKKQLVEEYDFLKEEYGFYADVDLWMKLLHSHDAYYCSDVLITGPSKKIQPRLFDDNLAQVFLKLFNMQLKHRKQTFNNQPLKLIPELSIFGLQTFINLSYCLLLIVKNFSFKTYIDAAGILKQKRFLIPWLIILFSYPILYPSLKAFGLFKGIKRKSLAPSGG
jgi:glycosyltransferase involved in cell wall biosynthesis